MKLRVLAGGLLAIILIGCSKPLPEPKRPAKRPPPSSTPAVALNPDGTAVEPDVRPPDSGGIGPSQAPGAGATLLAGRKDISLQDITDALRAYVISRQITSKGITNLDVLVKHKFLPSLPPPPPGKKYAWDKFSVVSLEDK
jgi:hypothetical protein